MENPIKQIVKFNEDAGLVDKGYDDFLESSFQIEEALEGLMDETSTIELPSVTGLTPKELAREIVKKTPNRNLSDVDRLDKALDAVVFAVGSIRKLGLNAQQITKALNVVMQANQAKLSCPKDEHGKLRKPDDFNEKYAPEPKLQAILNERGKKCKTIHSLH